MNKLTIVSAYLLGGGLVIALIFAIYYGLSHLVVWGLGQFGVTAPFWGVFAGWIVLSAIASMFKGKSNA